MSPEGLERLRGIIYSEDAQAVLYGVTGTHPEAYGGVTKDEALECAGALVAALQALVPPKAPALANLIRERETARGDLAAAWDDGFTYATRLAYGGPMRDGDPNPYRGTGCSDPTCTEDHSHDR